MHKVLAAVAFLAAPALVRASDPPTVPLTRGEMKRQMEESKRDVPRLKAPPISGEGRSSSTSGTEDSRLSSNIQRGNLWLAHHHDGSYAERGCHGRIEYHARAWCGEKVLQRTAEQRP